METQVPIFSPGEIFKFPVNEVNTCDAFYSPNYNIPFGIRIPIYSTIHDVVFLDIKGLTNFIGFLIRKLTLWRAIQISKKIFTVSDFSKRRIIHHFGNDKDIIVATTGISSELKQYAGNETSPYEFPYFLFIGNIKKHKGLDLLLDAYEKACSMGLKQKLVIVGSFDNFKTKDKDFIRKISKQDDNVIFTGKISNEEIYRTIEHATMLIQPSRYEGFGLPPLEAMYLGCPAIISNIQVFNEVYATLPVHFFDLNNTEDLLKQLISADNKRLNKNDLREKIDALYSFKKSSSIVMAHLKN